MSRTSSAGPSAAELLRTHRVGRSMTIESLAQSSGVSDRTISDIERGVSRSPQQRTLHALATALRLGDAEATALYRAARPAARRPLPPDRATAIAPVPVGDFTGRELELAAIAERLSESASSGVPLLVVICGSPGIGKTTTAVEVLHRISAGARELFVDLAGLEALPLTPLQTLQSLLQQSGQGATARSLDAAAAAWRTVSAAEPTVVLLDNAANEEQLRPVLGASAPGTAVIATSRRSLSGLADAARVTLEPLAPGESIDLLAQIIPAAQRTPAELAELARLCGDVPLALRIAGNRIASQPSWTTADFIERMRSEEHRLRALRAGDLAVGAAFASSYDHLAPELRDLYRSLPLIEGMTFDARLAAAVIPTDLLDTEDLLDELTDLGLVEARGSTRYRLHSLARLHAADRMRSELDSETIRERRDNLRGWLMTTAARAGAWFEHEQTERTLSDAKGLGFLDRDAARAWLELEADSWFAAYRESAALGMHPDVLRVADSLHWFSDLWLAWGHWHEFFSVSAASASALGDALQEAAQFGYLAWADIVELSDPALAERDAIRAVEAADRSGDDDQRGWARFYLAWARDLLGRSGDAIEQAEDAVALFEAAGDREGVLQATSLIAAAFQKHYGPEEAIEAHRGLLEQLAVHEADLPENIALFTRSSAEQFLARAYLTVGRFAEAIGAARSSLAAAERIGYQRGIMFNLLSIAQAEAESDDGDLDEARHALDRAERLIADGLARPARFAAASEAVQRRRNGSTTTLGRTADAD
ncbi:transcriptional regulator with XRE-family HTH domain/tetratricopeptide (TPR) repeat protein [Leifsonia sp. EB41]|uniref:helix-turn-helix domain-containing protein n=1 Tax=Leifsonia sp. EB41 TaxID=3156260 RepID=UPI003512559B